MRDEGVLIIGSGNIVHNLGRIQWSEDVPPYDWAVRFDEAVARCVKARDQDALIAYPMLDAGARLSVPIPEHYLSLLYVIALQRPDEAVSFPVSGIEYGAIGMRAVAVGIA